MYAARRYAEFFDSLVSHVARQRLFSERHHVGRGIDADIAQRARVEQGLSKASVSAAEIEYGPPAYVAQHLEEGRPLDGIVRVS